MGLPQLFRTTPFRLTLLFLALFGAAAAAFLAYIYLSTVGEVTQLADRGVAQEARGLEAIYRAGGGAALLRRFAESSANDRPFLYLLTDAAGHRLGGSLAAAPISDGRGSGPIWMHFTRSARVTPEAGGGRRWAIGQTVRLSGGETLMVATDVTYAETFVSRIVRAMWGAAALVVLLGLGGGLLVSRNVNRSVARLNAVVAGVRGGDLRARVPLQGGRDEFDELGAGLDDMLDRLGRSIASIRHAGDAIAHDLRSPLTRLRTRLEIALLDVEAGKGDPKAALAQALDDADALLATFTTVLAIARLEAAGATPKSASFDPSQLAAAIAELYA